MGSYTGRGIRTRHAHYKCAVLKITLQNEIKMYLIFLYVTVRVKIVMLGAYGAKHCMYSYYIMYYIPILHAIATTSALVTRQRSNTSRSATHVIFTWVTPSPGEPRSSVNFYLDPRRNPIALLTHLWNAEVGVAFAEVFAPEG